MNATQIQSVLKNYLPAFAVVEVAEWIVNYKVKFRITRNRNSKLGDYKYDRRTKKHSISVNRGLNSYAFLITTVHEFAHLEAFQSHGFRIQPHGIEWKLKMEELMRPFVDQLPDDIRLAASNYLNNPKASSCSDTALNRVLRRYDDKPSKWLEEIPLHTPFQLRGNIYVAENKRRTRYLCKEINSGKKYLIHGQAEVEPVIKERN